MSDNNEDELHFKVKDLGIGTFLPLHFLISLTPIYPVFYLFYLYLNVFNFNIQLALIFLPLVIIGLLLIYVAEVVYLTKFILIISHWRSKPTEGINMKRDFGGKLVFHYHLRGFVKKFPLWLILRTPFPFLIKWMFNTFGLYKISKNVVLYDSWIGLEYIYLDENSIVGLGAVLSSHLVDGMNRLTIKGIHLRKNAQLGHNVLLAPGVTMGKNSIVRSNAGVPKLVKLKKNSVFKPGFYNNLYMKDIKGTGELKKKLGLRK